MVDPDTALIFDVDPARSELDGTVNVPLVEFLNIEIDTGGANVTPIIVTELNTLTLTAPNTTARETLTYELQEVGNILEVRLEGDFTAGIEVYGVEAVLGALQLGVRVCEVN